MSHEVWAAASWHSQMILTFWVVQCCVSGTPLAQAERRWTKPRMLMIGLWWSHFEQIFAVVAQSISNVGTPNFWKSDWPLIYSGQLSNLHWTWAWLDVLWGHLEEFRTNVDLDLELDKWGKQRFRPLFYFQYQAYLHHHEKGWKYCKYFYIRFRSHLWASRHTFGAQRRDNIQLGLRFNLILSKRYFAFITSTLKLWTHKTGKIWAFRANLQKKWIHWIKFWSSTSNGWLNTTADKMAPDRYMVWNELISNYEWNVPTMPAPTKAILAT